MHSIAWDSGYIRGAFRHTVNFVSFNSEIWMNLCQPQKLFLLRTLLRRNHIRDGHTLRMLQCAGHFQAQRKVISL